MELGEDRAPQMTVASCLEIFGRKPITYYNPLLMRKRVLLLQGQINYSEDIIVTRETASLGVLKKKVIQVISGIGQANYIFNQIITWITLFGKIV